MINLSALLERFAKSLGKDVITKETVLVCIEKITSIRLEEKDISIKEGVLEIISSPGKKNEIRLKEDRIIEALKSQKGIYINKIFYK